MEINCCKNGEPVAAENQRIGLIQNPYIKDSKEDFLFHLALGDKRNDFKALFGDVKFVVMGGTVRRIKEFALFIAKELKNIVVHDEKLIDFTESGNRFSMFKVGPVLCVNHGIGYASVTIVLHEIIKLLHHAAVKDPVIFRIGTSGGVGIATGTVVIAKQAVNDFFEECFEIPVLGKRVKIPAVLNQKLATDLKNICAEKCFDFPILSGKTMSHEHFYESVASVKASFCDRSDDERKIYFNLLRTNEVLNADMEVTAIAALTNQLGIKSAVVNVIVNDLLHPSENVPVENMLEWQTRPQKIVAEYIKNYLKNCLQYR